MAADVDAPWVVDGLWVADTPPAADTLPAAAGTLPAAATPPPPDTPRSLDSHPVVERRGIHFAPERGEAVSGDMTTPGAGWSPSLECAAGALLTGASIDGSNDSSTSSAGPPAKAVRSAAAIAAQAVEATKIYGRGDTAVRALDGVTVGFARGQFTAIVGPSGSGKSTLMHCLAGLDRVTSGRIVVGDTDLSTLGHKALTNLRRDRIGFVFQAFNLVPTLSALENITLPLALAGRKPDREWLNRVIDAVGLRVRLGHKPAQLSGGQQQRVAIARALVTQPDVIFADEPTGNLDSNTGAQVLSFMRDSVREMGQTVVLVTHDPVAAGYAERVVFLADGRVVDELSNATPQRVRVRMTKPGG